MGLLKIRIIKSRIKKNGDIEILVTNLNKFEFNKEDLKKLYGKRWAIETMHRNLSDF